MNPKNSILRILLLLVFYSSRTRGEFLEVITDTEHFLKTHKRTINDLDHYIEKEETRIILLKKHLKQYKTEHDKAMEDIPNYLGNPINAFTLLKRLTTDLDLIEESINIGTVANLDEYVKNMTMTHNDMLYPNFETLSVKIVMGLLQLQTIYLLQTEELAEGKFNGVEYSTPLTASDCFELGRVLYTEEAYDNSLEWMMVALTKYKVSNETYPFTEVDILEYIGYAHYLLGRTNTALKWTTRLLELDPNHQRARGNIPHYLKALEEEAKKKKDQRGDRDRNQRGNQEIENIQIKKKGDYGSLCRGERGIAPEISKRLKCWYETEKHPFLKYAPLKVEQMYIDPDILMFYEVISDDEIETLKSISKSRFKRDAGQKRSNVRKFGKSAWLWDHEFPVVERMSRRITHMTGLSVEAAEELQVFNYGVGGFYSPHHDFIRTNSAYEADRIATVLFYMSDVEQGGATVFTKLGLRLFPVKGAALFWLNLHSSGEGDELTLHGACPVLRGTKWVSNKWLHQGGQEFILPCELEYKALVRLPMHLQPASAR